MIQCMREFKLLLTPDVLHRAISLCMEQILKDTANLKEIDSIFQLKLKPTLSIRAYLERIFKFINASPLVFVLALILIDRLQESNDEFYMTCRNAHRLILTAIVVATKYYDDFYFKNSFYARLGGISTQLLNEMEEEFFVMINFDCYIRQATLKSYLERLEIFALVNASNGK